MILWTVWATPIERRRIDKDHIPGLTFIKRRGVNIDDFYVNKLMFHTKNKMYVTYKKI